MTTATLLERPRGPGLEPEGAGPTLDDLIVGLWDALAADRAAPCPVCGGALTARFGVGAGPVGGRCRDCGTELA